MNTERKPNGYWTKERCQEEALKYDNKTDFQKNSGTVYNKGHKMKWLNEICSHMIEIKKPHGYWTKERCQLEALKYSTRCEFYYNSPGVHSKAEKMKWLDEICIHMIEIRKPNGYWTKERCREEALKYDNRTDFQKKAAVQYNVAYDNKWLDEMCSHMIEKKKPNGYWTKERCHKEALNYTNRKEFDINSNKAFSRAEKMTWLDEICSHMTEKNKNHGYWTKEKCKEEALKYSTRCNFRDNSGGAYGAARKNKWLNDVCSHMELIGDRLNRCIYSYEFSDNYVYVGLTYNLYARQKSRDSDINDPVTKHIIETKLTPIRKQLSEYVPVKEAVILEGKYIDEYKINGWNLLNKALAGNVGGNNIYWTKERIINAAKTCITTHEFQMKYGGAYYAALKNGTINDIKLMLIKSVGGKKEIYTFERCQYCASLCKTKKEFKKNYFREYIKSKNKKWIDNFFKLK